jgi:hypothetical protein
LAVKQNRFAARIAIGRFANAHRGRPFDQPQKAPRRRLRGLHSNRQTAELAGARLDWSFANPGSPSGRAYIGVAPLPAVTFLRRRWMKGKGVGALIRLQNVLRAEGLLESPP